MEIIEKQQLCLAAYTDGKVGEAQKYAKEVLEELCELKRIPALIHFINQLQELGYPQKKIIKYEALLGQFQGRPGNSTFQLDWHIDHFKSEQEFFKTFILDIEEWDQKHFELCYEYILRFGEDEEVFSKLDNLKQVIPSDIQSAVKSEVSLKNLNFNYEQIAYELISGKKTSDEFGQKGIIKTLKFIDFEKNKKEGREMAIAFRFLGMDEVVVYLCDRLSVLHNDISELKDRASLVFLGIESLLNLEDYHTAQQKIELFIADEPIYGDEKLAFIYLKAEVNFLMGKKSEALKYFQDVYKINPHYRFVRQRLKLLEAN
jgi:tetratricopeptide (TPR) repeat protein